MQNVITEPTRQNAILDPIRIQDDMPNTDCGVIDTPANISDHKATFLLIPFDYEIQNSYTILIWLYKWANFEDLHFQLRTLTGTAYPKDPYTKHVSHSPTFSLIW